MSKLKEAKLIIASSEENANLYYATHFLAPDPFTFIQIDRKKILIMNDLEIDRARKEARVHKIISSTEIRNKLKAAGNHHPSMTEIIHFILTENHVSHLLVPSDFPVASADRLRKKGYLIRPKDDPFFEERAIKTPREIKWIANTQRKTEKAVRKAEIVLRKSNIRGKYLVYQGKRLTSEKLRQIIDITLLELGCSASHTIVSCGNQTTEPHHRGKGPLLAHQPIIIDVFPQSNESKYHADMTRTFVRGKASPKIRKMYAAVKEAQTLACKLIREGINAKVIHRTVTDYFNKMGFPSGQINGKMQGFFHSTGHGIGLDVHESPRISVLDHILREGHIVTVEPGLYYPGTGGVRIEDMVAVTKTGCRNLTRYRKVLEVK